MVKTFLITRPNHDLITSYLYEFSKGIVKLAKESRDIHVTDLEGDKATRSNVEEFLNKENPGLIFLNGHGNREKVAGYKDEVVLDKKNIILTKKKIVYALSCDSLEEIGKIAIEKGTKAYIGYKSRFMLVYDPFRVSTPNKDKNALPFKRACNILITSLVSGVSVEKAIEKAKEEYNHLIKSYGTSEDDPYGDISLIRLALTWNLEFLDMYGDANASFNE